ncbi:MAG: NnrU family protein, partial [Pseudomonadota bacterium]
MLLLILGLALWYATHLLKPMAPARRAELAERLGGEGSAKIAMAIASVVAVALMTIGYQTAGYVQVWTPPAFLVHLNNLLMVIAVVLFFAGGVKGHVASWVRHPQLTGFKLWAVAHLLVNGNLEAIILFGGLLAWAVIALVAINKRDGKGPKPAPQGLKPNLIHAGASVVAFLVITGAHNWAGYWPFPGSP